MFATDSIFKDRRSKMTLEEIREEANELSIEDLRDLSDFCNDLANALEEEGE